MRVKELLRNKGIDVVTIHPDATCRELLAILAGHNIGAVVISADGATVTGIVSERDVVRRLNDRGDAVLEGTVSDIAVWQVSTCDPDDDVEDLRETMTRLRIRHLPVVRAGRLVGIVSIGDIVKSTISQLEFERQNLMDYVQG
jgi:CBS domain-containing protein